MPKQSTNAKESHAYDPALNTKDAAAYLSISTDHLLVMARERKIASVRFSQIKGSPVLFRLSALNDWMRSREVKPLRNPLQAPQRMATA